MVAKRGSPIPTPNQAFAAFFYVRPNSRVYGIALRAGVSLHGRDVTESSRTEFALCELQLRNLESDI